MSIVKTHIIHQQYRDSVQLMRAASAASRLEGIEIASVLMGTPKNKPLLSEVNLLTSEAQTAGANDIIISVRAKTEGFGDEAIKFILEYLNQQAISPEDHTRIFRSIRGAIEGLPTANLAVISIPGEYAARETRLALKQNLNVFLFSDNVPLEDEIALKDEAHTRGLLLMGPDCGTAMIKNVGLGFTNLVIPGPIGIVAASGTGTQEVMVLCHNKGVGVTHAIGTGSRDIKDSVGGIAMIDGLHTLDRDPTIQLIIIVSKPPEEKTLVKVLSEVENCSKPIIINFLGKRAGYFDHPGRTLTVNTLEEAAYSASHFIQSNKLEKVSIIFDNDDNIQRILKKTNSMLTPKQKYIRGLFAGGTFTLEAAMLLSNMIPSTETLWTNVKLKGTKLLENPNQSKEHTLIDLGADEFTVGRPHPAIDQTERTKRFLKEINEPETAVILLDFILGRVAHTDPVSDMQDAFVRWKSLNRKIPIVVHICGTTLDPQDINRSVTSLQNLGVYVMPSNAQAARLAGCITAREKMN